MLKGPGISRYPDVALNRPPQDMDAPTLFLYIVAVSAVMITPGPSMLLALNNGACHGMRVARCGIAGAALSDLILIGAVGCGLGVLFFSAFLPQFIQPAAPVAQQYLVLAVTSAAIDCVMMSLYAFGGRHARRTFSARVMTWINRSCAGMLAAPALGLTLYRRSDLR
ncbi:LysE family translocator [Achromobacter marplatensis]|uniref:Uncharacterized protein n=1 Tax=Achromobacter marplatensis TaxID=470868 RepID=A0ABX9G7B1_9BURK|nr:hypothetical protein DFP87_10692 [Achromobacter marplatensis]CAB3663375.1 hypothetical protein LMG26219_03416 [Achromobacter marplatensis]